MDDFACKPGADMDTPGRTSPGPSSRSERGPADDRRHFKAALALFFGSGLCTLIYETLWVRQLTHSFGISVYAVSAVLATFMFGLGLGAYLLGRRSDRIRNPLRLYAGFELAISLYTLAVYFILAHRLPGIYAWASHLFDGAVRILPFALTFILLVLPTTLMGGTLPVLARYLDSDRRDRGQRGLGYLYGINTVGGVAGTGLAGFWLIKDLGIFQTTAVTVAANLAIALLALWLSRALPRTSVAAAASGSDRVPREATTQRSRSLILVTLLASGYTALSYEVIWNRTLLLHTRNSTYAFSAILMIFLIGIALGSLLFTRLPPRAVTARTLGGLQLGLAAYVWLSFYILEGTPSLLAALVGEVGVDSWTSALSIIAVATSSIVLVPTILMGMTFPMATLLIRGSATAAANTVSATTGRAYAFLTLGNILGSLVTGFLLIEWLGLRNAFAVGVAINLACGFLLWFHQRSGGGRSGRLGGYARGIACAGVALALFLLDVDRDFFKQYYGRFSKLIFYREEITDNVMVYEFDNGDRRIFYGDGRGTASISTNVANRFYGHLPMLLHPQPRSVLSICFGVGNTLSALAQHEPDRLVSVELSPGAIEAAPYFPSNLDVVATPNLEVVIEDGRNYLLRSEERFDVISMEPPRLQQAAVVNLYTREFYRLARDHLAKDGILAQWVATATIPLFEEKMVIRTFVDVFPNSALWSGITGSSVLLIGWVGDLHVDPRQLLARAERPRVRSDLARIQETPWSLLSTHLMGPTALRAYVGDGPLITDDRTLIDFSIPLSQESGFGEFDINVHRLGTTRSNAARAARRRHLLELEARAESPGYLFDAAETDRAMRERHSAALTAALEDARSRVHAKRRREVRQRIIQTYRQQ